VLFPFCFVVAGLRVEEPAEILPEMLVDVGENSFEKGIARDELETKRRRLRILRIVEVPAAEIF